MNSFFYMGRSERLVLLLAAVLIFAGSVIFAVGLAQKKREDKQPERRTQAPVAPSAAGVSSAQGALGSEDGGVYSSGGRYYSGEAGVDSTGVRVHAAPLQTPSPGLGKGTSASASTSGTEYSAHYVGAPTRPEYPHTAKLPAGSVVDLNSADTLLLQKVPGIGPAFAARIVKYRLKLGGYYTVLQLQEVYGMDSERFRQIKPYFTIGTRPYTFTWESIREGAVPQHPYLNYRQRSALNRLIGKTGAIRSWAQVAGTGLFTRDDSVRLSHYFLFGGQEGAAQGADKP